MPNRTKVEMFNIHPMKRPELNLSFFKAAFRCIRGANAEDFCPKKDSTTITIQHHPTSRHIKQATHSW